MVSYRQLERSVEVVSNLVVTVLVVLTLFEDLGISLMQLIVLTPEMFQLLLREYMPFFWIAHFMLLGFVLVEGYIAGFVRSRYPKAYEERYVPTVAVIVFILAFLSFVAFRRLLDLLLLLFSVVCIVGRG